MSRMVLFVSGPLHGQTQPVDDHTRTFIAAEPAELDITRYWLTDADRMPESSFRQVAYSLHQYVMFGRLIWIGYPGMDPPADDLMWDAMVSDAAKAAAEPEPSPAHP